MLAQAPNFYHSREKNSRTLHFFTVLVNTQYRRVSTLLISIHFTALTAPHNLFEASAVQAVQKDLRWTCSGEGAEGGAGDARSAQDRQQGVLAAPEAARRDRARHLAEP